MLINDPDKRIVWKSRYDAWEASGLSAAEWCRNEDIDKRQMYCWITCGIRRPNMRKRR